MPEGDPVVTPPPPGTAGGTPPTGDGGDSSTIRQMRDALDTARRELKQAQDAAAEALKAAERAKMDEVERLKAEAADGAKAKERADKLAGSLTAIYDAQVAALPEAQRDQVRTLTFVDGDPAASVERLRAAVALLPAPNQPAGSVTNPGGQPNPGATPPVTTFDPKNPPTLGQYFAARPFVNDRANA